ncbi:MAG: TIGR02281 family clan AA aspartic protease [Pseudomonadota bacterium]
MSNNSGFLAVGTLAIVLVFFGMRSFDSDGRFNPLREPQRPRLEVNAAGGSDRIIVSARNDGHFLLDTRINGRRTPMLVDTGASIVTLRASDARKAGIRPDASDYRIPFSTANGEVLGAAAVLPELVVSGVTLPELRVVILPDEKLDMSLFGVNGLNRFERRETSRDELILYTE